MSSKWSFTGEKRSSVFHSEPVPQSVGSVAGVLLP